jgi:hypothetical protein
MWSSEALVLGLDWWMDGEVWFLCLMLMI